MVEWHPKPAASRRSAPEQAGTSRNRRCAAFTTRALPFLVVGPKFSSVVMKSVLLRVAMLGLLGAVSSAAERINQEGRILGPAPVVTNSILFNTPEADAVLSAMQIFPVTHPWNEDISRRPVLPNSDAMIAQIISDLSASRRTLRVFFEMNFALVPDTQPLVPIDFFNYADESDPSPYPIPPNLPIETWPKETGTLTLAQWQQDTTNIGGDRHAIIVQPGSGFIRETWLTKLTNAQWQASNGAKFDLKTNALRPLGWTSGDAAGLAMFPALVRFDECQRGMVEHAVRLVVKRTRREYLYPATHYASTTPATQTNVPAMGQRLRLKSGFVVPDAWTREEKAVLKALKKYGAIGADNGNFFSISATPDDRWPAGVFDHLATIGITNFEVIQTTGPSEGPRSPGAPTADAGPDQTVPARAIVKLEGSIGFVGAPPTTRWKLYSGPGTVAFGDATQTNTTATFSVPGVYTLELSADDGVHAVAYDAVVITVTPGIHAAIARTGTNSNLTWTGGTPPFVLEQTRALPSSSWTSALTTSAQSATLPINPGTNGFFRVRGQ